MQKENSTNIQFTMDQIESARKLDTNGWIEIKGNPITKVGVFPYSGASLGEGFDPNEIYMVYRPEEELNNPETINSFKLLPWTDDHPERLLGNPDEGNVDPLKKGISGVTGEDVYFNDGYLKSNIKTFSKELADKINSGKKELSAGYKFKCFMQKGVYKGIKYDIVQRSIRGNHLSLVDSGRAGPDVSVLDQSENQGGNMPEDKDKSKMAKDETSLADIIEKLTELSENLAMVSTRMDKYDAKDQDEDEDEDEDIHVDIHSHKNDEEDEDDEEIIENVKKKDEDEDEDIKKSIKKEDVKVGMDALKKEVLLELSTRERLKKSLSPIIGVFDAEDMSSSQIAKYGIKKLGLTCKKGQEESVLNAYLAGQKSVKKINQSVAFDQSDYNMHNDSPDFLNLINLGGDV